MWHQLEDDSWDVQTGVPVQFRPPLVNSDSLLYSPAGHMVFLVQYLGLFQAALVARIVQMFAHRCSRGCRPAVCSVYLVPRLLLISPMYIFSQLSHFGWYTTPDCCSMGVLSFGFTCISLSLFVGVWYVDTPCFLKIRWSCSDGPCMYGMPTLNMYVLYFWLMFRSFFDSFFDGIFMTQFL